jgi:hypothetical protein
MNQPNGRSVMNEIGASGVGICAVRAARRWQSAKREAENEPGKLPYQGFYISLIGLSRDQGKMSSE